MLRRQSHSLFKPDSSAWSIEQYVPLYAPRKCLQYCGNPKLETKSAHSSVVHSVMIVLGELLSASRFPKVVGVCSAEGGSESVGEVSESVGKCGDVMTLRSYSSSASESA